MLWTAHLVVYNMIKLPCTKQGPLNKLCTESGRKKLNLRSETWPNQSKVMRSKRYTPEDLTTVKCKSLPNLLLFLAPTDQYKPPEGLLQGFI